MNAIETLNGWRTVAPAGVVRRALISVDCWISLEEVLSDEPLRRRIYHFAGVFMVGEGNRNTTTNARGGDHDALAVEAVRLWDEEFPAQYEEL